MGTCHLIEPSIPFKTVTSVTYTFDDGSTEAAATDPSVGMISVDSQLLTKTAFDAKYAVDVPL